MVCVFVRLGLPLGSLAGVGRPCVTAWPTPGPHGFSARERLGGSRWHGLWTDAACRTFVGTDELESLGSHASLVTLRASPTVPLPVLAGPRWSLR
eukprot:scaffold620_cov386-Prasinococcus_capsulatus_cf.AAC.16